MSGWDSVARAENSSGQKNINDNNARDARDARAGVFPRGVKIPPSEPAYNPFTVSSVPSVPSGTRLKSKRKAAGHRGTHGTEDYLQRTVVVFLSRSLPSHSLFWSTPNGDARGRDREHARRVAARLKAQGLVPGIPDLFVLHEGRLLGIELKAPPPRLASGKTSAAKPSVSDAQVDVMARLEAAGAPCRVCRSIDDVAAFLTEHGVPLKARRSA